MLMMVILAVSLDMNDVVAEAGDAMDVDAIVKRSPNDASESSGRSKNSKFACWCYKIE